MDNEVSQSMVAYENSPKEVNNKRRLPDGDKQFGKLKDTMPQDEMKASSKRQHANKRMIRHKEHR